MSESNRTQWEIENLHKKTDRHEERLNQQDEKITAFQSFKDSTVEKLIMIFKSIDKIEEESRWMKRSFTNTLVGGIISIVVALVIWLIQT